MCDQITNIRSNLVIESASIDIKEFVYATAFIK